MKLQMKILIFSSSYLPDHGGLQYLIDDLVKALESLQDLDVNFCVVAPERCLDYVVTYGDVQTYVEKPGLFGAVRKIRSIRGAIRIYNPDAILCWNILSDSFVASLARLFKKIPLIVSCHGEDLATLRDLNYGQSLSIWKRALIAFNHWNADRVITVSNSMNRIASEQHRFSTRKLRMIHNGINWMTSPQSASGPNDFLSDVKGFCGNRRALLVLGGHRRIKGLDVLFEALAILNERLDGESCEWCLIIGAEGQETDKYKEMVNRMGLGHQCTFVGFVTGETKLKLYEMADIYINPAFYEPFGLTYLEAVRGKCITISSIYGGGPEIFAGSVYPNLFIDPNSVETVVDALVLALKTERPTDQNVAVFRNRFSIEQCGRQYLSVIKEALF